MSLATLSRITIAATVWISVMSWMPGTYSTGRPISVARPIASSMASTPGMRRTNGTLPDCALEMKYRTKPKNSTTSSSTLHRVWLIHCDVARTGPVTESAGATPPGPTAVMR